MLSSGQTASHAVIRKMSRTYTHTEYLCGNAIKMTAGSNTFTKLRWQEEAPKNRKIARGLGQDC